MTPKRPTRTPARGQIETRSQFKKSNDKKDKQIEATKLAIRNIDEEYRAQEKLCAQLTQEVEMGIRGEDALRAEEEKLLQMKEKVVAQTNRPDAPTKPTDAPTKPTDAPTKPTNAPTKPTNAPIVTPEPMDLQPNTGQLSTARDELDIEWDIDLDNTQVVSPLEGVENVVMGHFVKSGRVYYVQRYGDKMSSSAVVSSELPQGSTYNLEVDVTERSNRILELILEKHKKQPIPTKYTRTKAFTVMLVYWDGKEECGYATDARVLDPRYDQQRRPHTRCFIHMNPALYAEYGLKNRTGFSHETRSTVKRFLAGKDDWERSIVLHNIAITRENKFEESHLEDEESRSDLLPLEEITDRKKPSGRSGTRAISIESKISPISPHRRTSPRLSSVLRQNQAFTKSENRLPSPSAPQHEASSNSKAVPPRELYLSEFIELHDLDKDTTADNLPEKYHSRYDAGYSKWKKDNYGEK
jgi:hypothetical protein